MCKSARTPPGQEEILCIFLPILGEIEPICVKTKALLDKYSCSREDCFAVELLLRESLNNAILHGSQEDPNKIVICRVQVNASEAMIQISDQGPGFDWRNVPRETQSQLMESGRGVAIYALYSTSFSFNESGNCITLRRTLG